MAFPLEAVFQVGNKLIDRLWPDPQKKAEAAMELQRMHQTGELAELAAVVENDKGQQAINLANAQSGSRFDSGWRPAIGWTCAIALFAYYVPRFVVATIFWSMQAYSLWKSGEFTTLPDMPEAGIADILGLVFTLLGASTLRMKEKLGGVARG